VGISDVVAEDHLTQAERAERGGWVGRIAGALSVSEYRRGLEHAGFDDVTIDFTQQAADNTHSAIIRAVKPKPTSRRRSPTQWRAVRPWIRRSSDRRA
jgi:hypothetical protein